MSADPAHSPTVTVAVDPALPVTDDDLDRIRAVDPRIVIVREDGAESATIRLGRRAMSFGGAVVAVAGEHDAAFPRGEFALAALLHFAGSATGGHADLRDRTMLVLGQGPTGRRLVRLGAALEMRVLAIDPSGSTDLAEVDTMRTEVFLGDLLPVSHAVIVTDSGAPALDAEALRLLRTDAVLIHLGIPGAVDLDAVADLLEAGLTAGVALGGAPADALPAEHRLRSAPGALIRTDDPGYGRSVTARAVLHFLAALHAHLRGEDPATVPAPQVRPIP